MIMVTEVMVRQTSGEQVLPARELEGYLLLGQCHLGGGPCLAAVLVSCITRGISETKAGTVARGA